MRVHGLRLQAPALDRKALASLVSGASERFGYRFSHRALRKPERLLKMSDARIFRRSSRRCSEFLVAKTRVGPVGTIHDSLLHCTSALALFKIEHLREKKH